MASEQEPTIADEQHLAPQNVQPPDFGELVDLYRRARGLSQKALAKDASFSQPYISYLERGLRRPSTRDHVRILADCLGLRGADRSAFFTAAGYAPDVPQHLSTESAALTLLGGTGAAAASDRPGDHVRPSERTRIYRYIYARTAFPTKWDERTAELERVAPGDVALMLNYLSELTRPPEYYRHSLHKRLYRRELVQQRIELLEQRRADLEARLGRHTVRHLYSIRGIEDYLNAASETARYRGIPFAIRLRQISYLLEWLNHPNFRVALHRGKIPANFELIGNNVVLFELDQELTNLKDSRIMGVEFIGSDVTSQFRTIFESIWNHKATIKDKVTVRQKLASYIAGA